MDREFSFRRHNRVRTQYEFDRVYAEKCFAADDVLVVQGASNELPHSRLGLSVSRKVGNAVVRARWKRLIRESFRVAKQEIPPGFDFVVRPRKGAEPDFQAVDRSLRNLASQVVRRIERRKSN